MEKHEFFMQRCLDLAQKGLGSTAPNPMVGAVLVHGGKIIGEGFTSPYGGSHAEVNAIQSAKDQSVFKDCTLYVSLEPCSHFGKTPPCSNLIIEKGIPRVVIGTEDTFSKVNGNGIRQLEENGVHVTSGVLQKECRDLNKRFFTFHEKKRPYIILKWAQSSDGFMDKDREKSETKINWITQTETKSLVHLWRSQEMGILVGRKTIENDNPKLDARLAAGKSPIRLLLDPEAKIEVKNWTHNQLEPTLIFNSVKNEKSGNIAWIQLPQFNLIEILQECYEREIQSILIEGGAHTLNQFIVANLWDEARILIGENKFTKGLKAPKLNQSFSRKEKIYKDEIWFYTNTP
ncbi:MAG: bifunctional diaminohydroxyphosphoribosylaminopyrimidine deaminase/5-amino-6-(5-phosphoribosylamino)uracil reductase RibD [Crocinitomicaceae bacterium]|nr:bifunctional diaminohydroxyphosphoribosylaminopyrimidine deaminase/5-amino-6-(5-phosphoribosylamino)uracil reductase RibD [Crocinitomicaceae bacterium]